MVERLQSHAIVPIDLHTDRLGPRHICCRAGDEQRARGLRLQLCQDRPIRLRPRLVIADAFRRGDNGIGTAAALGCDPSKRNRTIGGDAEGNPARKRGDDLVRLRPRRKLAPAPDQLAGAFGIDAGSSAASRTIPS